MNPLLILITFTSLLISPFAQAGKIKVACIGDSITYGAGIKNRGEDSYPAQLQRLLGSNYEVKNFGVSGRTMLNKGNLPWTKHAYYQQATAYQPNVVVIKLGTNDSKPINWKHKADFLSDALALIKHLQSLPTQPRILLCTPVPGLTPAAKNPNNIPGRVIKDEVVPLVREIAVESNSELIDLYSEFTFFENGLASVLPDKIHPNAKGAASIALRVADQILHQRNAAFSIEKQLLSQKIRFSKKNFHGYTSYGFKLSDAANASCLIVAPQTTIQGQLWIWRARFFGHQPDLDRALLDRGYHVAYCDISDLFGSPTAVKRWDKFYVFTQKLGLSKKPILEGMSRGGLIIFNWAKANPTKVAAVYGDNPVCDIRSWPAKSSAKDWKQCLKVWNKKPTDMPDFIGNPIDGLEVLAKVKVPLFLVLGKKDDVVPIAENGSLLARKYQALGGDVHVWEKPEGKHHPHGLHPIFPLLRHLLYATGNPIPPQFTSVQPSQAHQSIRQN